MLTRRSLLMTSALAGGYAALAGLARAAVPPPTTSGVYRYTLGKIRLTALYDGVWNLPIDRRFVRNAGAAEVDRAFRVAHLKPRTLPISFTALLVENGGKRVLIDTGTAGQVAGTAGFMNANLAAAGIEPKDIDTILISHFHPDHIDGIKTKDGAKVFANAEIWVPEPEWAFWMDDANLARAKGPVKRYFLNARRIFRDIAPEVRRFKPGAEVAPGIVSVPAFGHTPGHTAFAIHSGNRSMLAMSDTAREPWLFVRHPQWQPRYDMDGPLAAAARVAMLDRAAADIMLVEGYHFPFPACGHIAKTRTGYELVPVALPPL